MIFEHEQHPRVAARAEAGPVKIADQHARGNPATRLNAWVASQITRIVGTVWCFWAFNGLAGVSAKAAFTTHNPTVIVNWVSSNWIQLVLLPALMVGQNLQGKAADKRAEATFADAEVILHAADQIAAHLAAQDVETGRIQAHLLTQDDRLAAIVDQVTAAMLHLQAAVPTTQPDPGSTA